MNVASTLYRVNNSEKKAPIPNNGKKYEQLAVKAMKIFKRTLYAGRMKQIKRQYIILKKKNVLRHWHYILSDMKHPRKRI